MPKPVKKSAPKATANPKRPSSDPNVRAHQMIAEIKDKQVTGQEAEMPAPTPAQISTYMSKLGSKGGKASGAKRMENLTEARRREIASQAARKRWAEVARKKAARKH